MYTVKSPCFMVKLTKTVPKKCHSSPGEIANWLSTLSSLAANSNAWRVAVGCGGNRDRSSHISTTISVQVCLRILAFCPKNQQKWLFTSIFSKGDWIPIFPGTVHQKPNFLDSKTGNPIGGRTRRSHQAQRAGISIFRERKQGRSKVLGRKQIDVSEKLNSRIARSTWYHHPT